MVKDLIQEQESYRSKLFHFRGMFEGAGRHTKSLSIESATKLEGTSTTTTTTSSSEEIPIPTSTTSKSQVSISKPPTNNNDLENNNALVRQKNINNNVAPVAAPSKEEVDAKETREKLLQEMEQMKERFAKLLLGEDMSGGGKGVSSALALSNAFTNLAAAVFGEQKRLEPMPVERKSRWRKEIDLLLSVTDYIVEMVPSQQKAKDGSSMEIMTTRQRTDLHMNIPALRKLDTMLIDCLDNFKDQNEFYYVKKDEDDSEKDGPKQKNDDKWWLPTPKVPAEGLSEATRRFLQYQKDCVNQVLKAAMAINAQTLSEMEIPESYIESLPKNGRSSLGEHIYKSITVEFFDPDQFLSTMDLSSEHKILDLKNRIEASIVIWRRKMNSSKDSKSAWGSAVSIEKREQFEDRAETILLLLKHRFPGIPQSALDISKIQFNGDVGQAVLESYSRILESLAFTVLSRIEDVLLADQATQTPSNNSGKKSQKYSSIPKPNSTTPMEDGDGGADALKTTLSDVMGWHGGDQGESFRMKDPFAATDDFLKDLDSGKVSKLSSIVTDKKVSYLETLGVMRSPTSRH